MEMPLFWFSRAPLRSRHTMLKHARSYGSWARNITVNIIFTFREIRGSKQQTSASCLYVRRWKKLKFFLHFCKHLSRFRLFAVHRAIRLGSNWNYLVTLSIHQRSMVIRLFIQGVPLATEPGISLIILTAMKILQRNLNRSAFVVWEMKRNLR
jgi:hypothetical protein